MQLECQYSKDGYTCGLNDVVSGDLVPLDVSVTVPHGLTNPGTSLLIANLY